MNKKWLTARRDALFDRALGYAIPPVFLLVMFLISELPPVVLATLGGFAAGAASGEYKKTPSVRKSDYVDPGCAGICR